MFKGFAVSAALLLLLVSGAMATIQVQGFDLGQTNYVADVGDGAAGNVNAIMMAANQSASGPAHTVGYQGTIGSLMQAAGAVATNGLVGVSQTGDAVGGQSQALGTDIQMQDLYADLVQDVTKVGGQGVAVGLQTFIGIQTQLTFSPWGGSANVQGIGVNLYDAVGGGPGGATAVSGGANVNGGQY